MDASSGTPPLTYPISLGIVGGQLQLPQLPCKPASRASLTLKSSFLGGETKIAPSQTQKNTRRKHRVYSQEILFTVRNIYIYIYHSHSIAGPPVTPLWHRTLSQPCPEELLSPQLPQIQPQNAKHYVDQQSELPRIMKAGESKWTWNWWNLQNALNRNRGLPVDSCKFYRSWSSCNRFGSLCSSEVSTMSAFCERSIWTSKLCCKVPTWRKRKIEIEKVFSTMPLPSLYISTIFYTGGELRVYLLGGHANPLGRCLFSSKVRLWRQTIPQNTQGDARKAPAKLCHRTHTWQAWHLRHKKFQ